MLHLILVVLAIAIIASLVLWAIRSAPDQVLNADFKGVLGWLVIVVAVVMIVVKLLALLNVNL